LDFVSGHYYLVYSYLNLYHLDSTGFVPFYLVDFFINYSFLLMAQMQFHQYLFVHPLLLLHFHIHFALLVIFSAVTLELINLVFLNQPYLVKSFMINFSVEIY
jgi:hypothetical protein